MGPLCQPRPCIPAAPVSNWAAGAQTGAVTVIGAHGREGTPLAMTATAVTSLSA